MHRRLVLGVLVAVSIALITIDHRDPGFLLPLRELGNGIYGPPQTGVAGIRKTAADAVQGTSNGARLARLERENQLLRQRIWADRLTGDKAEQVARLRLKKAKKIIPAQVTAAGAADTVSIDAGTRQGVRRDLTVFTGGGLVGRVRAAGPDTATVLLVSRSSIGARVQETGEIGVLTDGTRLRLLNTDVRLRAGHTVETFGSKGGRPYVAGIPIGTVKTDTGRGTGVVAPTVRLSALDVVGVIVP